MTDVDADGNTFSRDATLGDIVTSERTVAALVRQHVYSPPHLFGVPDRTAQQLGADVADVDFANIATLFAIARDVNDQDDPALWGDAEQAALAAHMSADAGNPPQPLNAHNLDRVANWPEWAPRPGTWEYDPFPSTPSS
jgi:hypothetical protein